MKKGKILIIPILAALFGLMAARIFQANGLLAILIAFLLWLGTTLIQVDDYQKSIPIPKKEMSTDDYIKLAFSISRQLFEKAYEVEDETLQMYIRSVSNSIAEIADSVKADPSKFTKNRKVFDYYIPSVLKFVEQYDEIENKKLTSVSSKEYMQKVKQTVVLLDKSFKNILNNIHEYDILDSTADMQVLENLLKMEGNTYE